MIKQRPGCGFKVQPPASTTLFPVSPCFTKPTQTSSSYFRGPLNRRVGVSGLSGVAEKVVNNGVVERNPGTPLRVIVVGAGIGGLVLSVALLKKGVEVVVLERDVTAIRGEGKYRGPIQVQSNALAALEAIDAEMAREVFSVGCVTGDRINGLCDGETGEWYVKFDTFHPAVSKGLPVTRVISRHTLQEILTKYVQKYGGVDIIQNSQLVTGYEENHNTKDGEFKVNALLEDGTKIGGDMLIGADGIWSKVRKQLIGPTEPNYSQYTCYTGIADFTPADINTVGYRVFLGNGQYFVSSDVGDGKMQWYGFHKEPAGGDDPEGGRQARLMQIFGHWTHMVTDLIMATKEEDILRRDIYDRPPIYPWAKGHVALLGDSAHAMQPNLGQGGCMAIEDGYQLGKILGDELTRTQNGPTKLDIPSILRNYQNSRVVRAGVIHGMAGMAALMASTYKAYFGEGLGPLEWIKKYRIPHFGRVAGQVVMKPTMPFVLDWVLGGNIGAFKESDRAPYCLIEDYPEWMSQVSMSTFIKDDDALLRAADANWILYPKSQNASKYLDAPLVISQPGVTINVHSTSIGAITNGNSPSFQNFLHFFKDGDDYFLRCNNLNGMTNQLFQNERPIKSSMVRLLPDDEIQFGDVRFGVKMQHKSVDQPSLAMAN